MVRTILLVEDDPDLRDALAGFLRRRGYAVVAVGDGAEAEAILSLGLPDLLVTDMMLPGRSGFQLAQQVRANQDRRVPVVMVSGNDALLHRYYAEAVGVDVFLAKPFAAAALVAAVEALCPRVAAPRPAAYTPAVAS